MFALMSWRWHSCWLSCCDLVSLFFIFAGPTFNVDFMNFKVNIDVVQSTLMLTVLSLSIQSLATNWHGSHHWCWLHNIAVNINVVLVLKFLQDLPWMLTSCILKSTFMLSSQHWCCRLFKKLTIPRHCS
jgi:hypothetical protein